MARVHGHCPTPRAVDLQSLTVRRSATQAFPSQRIATLAPHCVCCSAGVRKGGVLTYMLTDHLGSTSLMTNASGAVISETRYTAWGEVRYQAGTMSTGYTYTGQYSNTADFGLMYYNARWYDPSLGRFARADTIVPAGVQGYDRYAYVNNNPVKYTDPSGHAAWNDNEGNNRNRCDLDCWRDKNQDESEQDSCTYHLCSDTNLYELGWDNFSQAQLIWSNPNATYSQRYLAGIYMNYWGGAHVVGAVGSVLLAWEAVLAIGSNYATKNPDAAMTMLGRYYNDANNYISQAGTRFTYFDLGTKYAFLDKIGLAKPINQKFIIDQIALAKDFVVYGAEKPGGNLMMETNMILSSGFYAEYGSFGHSVYSNFIMYSH